MPFAFSADRRPPRRSQAAKSSSSSISDGDGTGRNPPRGSSSKRRHCRDHHRASSAASFAWFVTKHATAPMFDTRTQASAWNIDPVPRATAIAIAPPATTSVDDADAPLLIVASVGALAFCGKSLW